MTVPERRPNILWICTDQQRFDTIAALGNRYIRTPNLDRLCAAGVAFSRTYCQSPICTPSRASFLTGRYPSATHVNRNGNSHYPLEGPKLITRRLADAGYTCGLAGKLHLSSAWRGVETRTDDGYSFFAYSHAPFQHGGTNLPGSPMPPAGQSCGNHYIDWLREIGVNPDDLFDTYAPGKWGAYHGNVDPDLRQTAWCGQETLRFIREQRDKGPWLMSVNFFDPHDPFNTPDSVAAHYLDRPSSQPIFAASDPPWQENLRQAGIFFQTRSKPPDENLRKIIAGYYGNIELIDRQVGRMLDALVETGEDRNTVVIFTSDHGEMLGDHGLVMKGCRFYEGLVHVPLIISFPGRFRQGVVCDDLVELTDLAPTIAELAGVQLPPCDGRSLLPYLSPGATPAVPRSFVRCEYLDAAPANESDPTRRTFGTMYFDGRWKVIGYHGHGVGELYDLQTDPAELHNRWDDPAAARIKMDLMQLNFDAMVRAADLGPPMSGEY